MTINLYGPNHSFSMARNETHMIVLSYAGGNTAGNLKVYLDGNATPAATGQANLDIATTGNLGFGGEGVSFFIDEFAVIPGKALTGSRSEEHTSELQSLMRISYAVFCLQTQST